ncbi:hypothetical protein [Parafrankia sp. CH37]|uniref:hypothetical protein n=1 Tax=Parafrankia sp. CH37 TaxID=683308 RepID=UPI001D01DEEB|nr:hypothetical protein [Parafrankia sp. CH37]
MASPNVAAPSTSPTAAEEGSGSTGCFIAVLLSAAVVGIRLVLFWTRRPRRSEP